MRNNYHAKIHLFCTWKIGRLKKNTRISVWVCSAWNISTPGSDRHIFTHLGSDKYIFTHLGSDNRVPKNSIFGLTSNRSAICFCSRSPGESRKALEDPELPRTTSNHSYSITCLSSETKLQNVPRDRRLRNSTLQVKEKCH